jgi:hypothetical protein
MTESQIRETENRAPRADSVAERGRNALSQEFVSNLGAPTERANGSDVRGLPGLELYDSSAPKTQWTVAVDLTTDLALPNGREVGAKYEFNKLQELAAASKGNDDVAIAVQAANSETCKLDRYIIRDGHITNADSVDSQGMAANQASLLQFATAAAPSENIGMIIEAHGNGASGVRGGAGRESLSELSGAIQAGLAGTGHDRLNLLDMDSCSMSSAAAIGGMANVADNLVVSELRERVGDTFSAQNLNAVLSRLMQNPQMSSSELGDAAVREANEGAVPEVLPGDPFKHVGADVLSNIDTAQYANFSQALDQLGTELSDAAQDAGSRQVIERLMDGTSSLPGGQNFDERRDLREFFSSLRDAAASGNLGSGSASIEQAAQQALDAQATMTKAVHISNAVGFDQLGGIYGFLPVQAVRDGSADGPNGLQWMETKIAHADFSKRDQLVGALSKASENIIDRLSQPAQQQFAPITAAIDEVKKAQSNEEFTDAMRALNETVSELQNTQVETELRQDLLTREDVPNADGWNEFTHSFAS